MKVHELADHHTPRILASFPAIGQELSNRISVQCFYQSPRDTTYWVKVQLAPAVFERVREILIDPPLVYSTHELPSDLRNFHLPPDYDMTSTWISGDEMLYESRRFVATHIQSGYLVHDVLLAEDKHGRRYLYGIIAANGISVMEIGSDINSQERLLGNSRAHMGTNETTNE